LFFCFVCHNLLPLVLIKFRYVLYLTNIIYKIWINIKMLLKYNHVQTHCMASLSFLVPVYRSALQALGPLYSVPTSEPPVQIKCSAIIFYFLPQLTKKLLIMAPVWDNQELLRFHLRINNLRRLVVSLILCNCSCSQLLSQYLSKALDFQALNCFHKRWDTIKSKTINLFSLLSSKQKLAPLGQTHLKRSCAS